MKTTLISPKDLDKELVSKWREWQIVAGHPLNPFYSPDFALAYGLHQKKARVAILEVGNEIVGFFPLELASMGVARSMAYGLSDVQAPTLKPGFELDRQQFLSATGLSVFEFDRLLPQFANQLSTAAVRLVPSPVIDLSAGYEQWLAGKRKTSSSRFRRILQKQRQIGRELGEVEFVYASTSHTDLSLLMAWKSAQYVRTGRRDRFAKPWFRKVMHELLERSADDFGLAVSKLSANGRTLALDAGLRNAHTFAGWFPAYDLEFAGYSPGNVCLLMQIEAAASNGITRMDLGVGAADYKESFKNYDVEVAEGWCTRPSPFALMRWATKVPKEAVTDFVLERPQLRQAARSTLNFVGAVRHRAIGGTTSGDANNPKTAGFVGGVSVAASEWSTALQVVPFL